MGMLSMYTFSHAYFLEEDWAKNEVIRSEYLIKVWISLPLMHLLYLYVVSQMFPTQSALEYL